MTATATTEQPAAIAAGRVSNYGLFTLEDKIAKLNKRAVRLGMEPLTLTVTAVERKRITGPSGLDRTVTTNCVEVKGIAPRINGWTVVARIEFTEAGNLVHSAPDVDDLDSKYRTAANVCDHCNTNRKRNDIVVIRHNDGRELRVGRNCLADYLRTDDAESLLAYASWLNAPIFDGCDEDGDHYRGGRSKPVESVETIVRAASICIRKLGWKSSSAAYDGGFNSTKADVYELLYPPMDRFNQKEWERWVEKNDLTVNDYDKDLAAKAIEWIKSADPGQSDYLANLKVLVELDYIGFDKFGYVVSLIIAYNNARKWETERKEKADKAAAKGEKVYIGEPKKRIKGIKATCKGVSSFEGHYGVTTLVRFEHRISETEYAVLVWWASGDKTEDFDEGEDYTFDATPKKHEDHDKYGKQTVVNRVTVK